jgi:hypothetical protein
MKTKKSQNKIKKKFNITSKIIISIIIIILIFFVILSFYFYDSAKTSYESDSNSLSSSNPLSKSSDDTQKLVGYSFKVYNHHNKIIKPDSSGRYTVLPRKFFYIDVIANDLTPAKKGVYASYLDVQYSPASLVRFVNFTFSDNLKGVNGNIDTSQRLIDDIGGFDSLFTPETQGLLYLFKIKLFSGFVRGTETIIFAPSNNTNVNFRTVLRGNNTEINNENIKTEVLVIRVL